MRLRQEAVLQSLRQARAFLDAHEAVLGLAQTDTRRLLNDAIADLSEHAVTQVLTAQGRQGETEKLRLARVAIRADHMRPIAQMAKLRLRDEPAFSALRMPRHRIRHEEILAAASAMVDAARPHEQLLITTGLPVTFLADLEDAAETMRKAIDERGQHRRRHAGATAGLIASERRGRGTLKALDELVLPRLRRNEPLAHEWRTARHITRPASSSADESSQLPESSPAIQPPASIAA